MTHSAAGKPAISMRKPRHVGVNHEMVLEMVKRYQETGCQKAITWLVQEHRVMCYSIAQRYAHRFEVDDSFQDAMESLIHSANDFDVGSGFNFSSHAYCRIMREVSRKKIRQWNIIGVPDNKDLMKVFRKINSLGIPENLSMPEAKRLALSLNVNIEHVYGAIWLYYSSHVSLDFGNILEEMESDEHSPESIITQLDIEVKTPQLVRSKMQGLNEKETKVIELRHLMETPLTLTEAGAQLGVSAERVRQLEKRALAYMVAA